MGARHFEGHLPSGVELLHTAGTESGNPSSDVTYGFRLNTQPPQFAVAALKCNYDQRSAPQTVSRERTVTVVGPLSEEEYGASPKVVEPVVGNPNATLSQDDIRMEITATVPRASTSEQVISRIVGVVFSSRPFGL